MTRHDCARCDWRGEDADALAEHSAEAGHPLCVCCFRSLGLTELQSCTRCVGRVGRELAEVVELYAMLPGTLGHLHTCPPDAPGSTESDETPIPGGDALVMLSGGSAGLQQLRQPERWVETWKCRSCGVDGVLDRGRHLLDVHSSSVWSSDVEMFDPAPRRLAAWDHEIDEWPDDAQSAAYELSRWEDDLRLVRGEPAATEPATVVGAVGYLAGERLRWAGDYHPAFDELATDVHRLVSRLRTATATALRPMRGVPCLTCGTELEREFKDRRPGHGCLGHWDRCAYPYEPHGCTDSGGLVDDWTCPRCRRVYTEAEYGLAVAQRHALASRGLVLASTIEQTLGIREGRLRQWANRGKVSRRGYDEKGRTLYDSSEVREHAVAVGCLPGQ